MQNRREHYRHSFAPEHRLHATFVRRDGARSVPVEITNLSVGGACVLVEEPLQISEGRWHLEFDLEGVAPGMDLRVECVRVSREPHLGVGLRFVFPILASVREDLERKIAKYLIEVQRYERQVLRERKRTA